jgi:hypothetical protein
MLLTLGLVVILAIVFTAVAYFMSEQLGTSQADLASQRVRGPLTNACNAYKLKNGDWPNELNDLLDEGERGGPYLSGPGALRDPWGNPFHYDFHGLENDRARPDIWAVNPANGQKIGNWPQR